MKRFRTITLGLLLGASSAVQGGDVGFDCWVGTVGGIQTTNLIRCIQDQGDPQGVVADSPLVNTIHTYLHSGAVFDAERLVKANPALFRDDGVVSILLYSYPTESSWENLLPQALVQSALCNHSLDCPVYFHRAVPLQHTTATLTRSRRR